MRCILLIVALLVTLNRPVFAEDEQKNLIYEIGDFSGGLNEKTSPFSLPKNQGDVCQNIRFNTEYGSIAKRDNLNVYGTVDATNPILGMHRFYLKDGTKVLLVNVDNKIYSGNDTTGAFTEILTVSTGSRRWQWLTWHDIAIGCDGYNQPVKYDGSSDSATYLGTCLATASTTVGNPNGTYSYKVSFYTDGSGAGPYEVIFDTASNSVTASSKQINLTMIPIGPDTYGGEDVVGRKIYRLEGSTYKLLSNGTIADNFTVTLTDNDATASGASYPAGDATYKPPTGRFSIINNGRLWFANDPSSNPSTVWYGDSESHDVFLDDAYWNVRQDDGDAVTFIKQILGILTIGKNNSICKLYTDGIPSEWILSDPYTFIGCQAPYTASNYARGIIYLARDGIYTFNGQYPQLISDAVTPIINDINSSDFENCWGIYHRNMYYLAFSSELSGVGYNNRVLVYDLVDDAYSLDLLDINTFCAFNSGSDWGILYYGDSSVGKVYSQTVSDNSIKHRRQSDFDGLWDDMRYIPVAVGGDVDNAELEIAWTESINELGGSSEVIGGIKTIDDLEGIIDRPDVHGNYVSQVVRTNVGTYDKLYWNESIPTTGGDVSVRMRTSDTGEENFLLNDCFEFWDNNPTIQPNDWHTPTSIAGAGASSSTTTKRGNYSAALTPGATMTQVFTTSGATYRGKSLTFTGWIKSASSKEENAYLELDDDYSTSRAYYGVESTAWRETATTLVINSNATRVTARCAVLGDASDGAFFDQVMCIEAATGTTVNDWTAWSSAFTNSAGTDISGETVGDYLQYLIEATATSINYSPTLVVRDNYIIRLTYEKEGTEQTDSIPIKWRSGWLDFEKPMYTKSLRKLTVYHEGTEGTLTITIENLYGDTETFDIDLATYPERYTEYFTTGAFTGRQFRVTITNSDANPIIIKRVEMTYDVNPLV